MITNGFNKGLDSVTAEPTVLDGRFDSRYGIRQEDRLRPIATVCCLTVQSASAEGKKSAFVGTLVLALPWLLSTGIGDLSRILEVIQKVQELLHLKINQ